MQVFTGWLLIRKHPIYCTTTGLKFFYRQFAAAQAA